jgi:hypothetical protein
MSVNDPKTAVDKFFMLQLSQDGTLLPLRRQVDFSGVSFTDDPVNQVLHGVVTGSSPISGQNDVVLANGLNSNIATLDHPVVRATGPTAAFTVGGFAPGSVWHAGQRIMFVNTTGQLCTIIHEDTSSTAANRINTPYSFSIILPPKKSIGLIYDGDLDRFIPEHMGFRYDTFVNVKDLGAVGDGIADDSSAINAAISAVGSSGQLLFSPGTYHTTGTITVPAGVSTRFELGAKISASAGTVTFNGPIVAAPYQQIFDLAGGTYALGPHSNPRISVVWYGADPLGNSDAAAAFNAAIAGKDGNLGGVLHIPTGTYLVNSTIDFGAAACVVTGDGWANRDLTFSNRATYSKGTYVYSSVVSGFGFTIHDNPADYGIAESGIVIRDIAFVNSTYNGTIHTTATGLSIRPSSGAHGIVSVSVDNVFVAGFAVGFNPYAAQSCHFYNLRLTQNTTGLLMGSLNTASPSPPTNVSFHGHRGGGNFGANIELQNCAGVGFFGGEAQGGDIGVYIHPVIDPVSHVGSVAVVSFDNFWFEDNNSGTNGGGKGNIVFDASNESLTDTVQIYDVVFRDCRSSDSGQLQYIRGGTPNGSTFLDVHYDNCVFTGVDITLPNWSHNCLLNGSVFNSITDLGTDNFLIDSKNFPTPGAAVAQLPELTSLNPQNLNAGVHIYSGVPTYTTAGIAINRTSELRTVCSEFVIDFSAFTPFGAVATATVTLALINVGTHVEIVTAETTTAYAGPAGTIQLQIGIDGGSINEYILAHDVKTSAVIKGLVDGDLGTELARSTAVQGGGFAAFSSTHYIQAKITIGTGTVNQLTQGSTRVRIRHTGLAVAP